MLEELTNHCLQCKKPKCVIGCPVHNDIPTIIKLISEGKLEEAYDLNLKTSVFPYICGYLCPHEKQCEGHCIRGIKGDSVKIGTIERTLASRFQNEIKMVDRQLTGVNIAIIGGGVSGMACALDLTRHGASVTIFESREKIGGAVTDSIPNFRFDDSIFSYIIKNMQSLGIIINYNTTLGSNLFLQDLKDFDYQVFALGTTKSRSNFNEPHEYILDGINFLSLVKLNKYKINSKKALVIGAGNVAMDVARTLARKKVDTTIVYRRTLSHSPALETEIALAVADGVKFLELASPIKPIIENKILKGLSFEKMELLDELDSSNRPKIRGTNRFEIIEADLIVEAIGSQPNYDYFQDKLPEIFENGWISRDTNLSYGHFENFFFIGDFMNGATTVVNAMKSGLDAAQKILEIEGVN